MANTVISETDADFADMPEFTLPLTNKLQPGTYRAVLKEVTSDTRKKFDFDKSTLTEEVEAIVKFVFFIPTESTELLLRARPTLNERGTLLKTVRSMAGAALTPDIARDPMKIWILLKSFIGDEFLINCQDSKTGKSTNIVAVLPIK